MTDIMQIWAVIRPNHFHFILKKLILITDQLFLTVDEMIAEVDIDGDGRIDFEGKFLFLICLPIYLSVSTVAYQIVMGHYLQL